MKKRQRCHASISVSKTEIAGSCTFQDCIITGATASLEFHELNKNVLQTKTAIRRNDG